MVDMELERRAQTRRWTNKSLREILKTELEKCDVIQPVHPKGNQSWIFTGRSEAEGEIPILWPPDAKNQPIGKDPGKDRAGEGEDRGWDSWMASLTRTWVWVSSGSWWRTGKPGRLLSMGSQRVRHQLSDWTELKWTDVISLLPAARLHLGRWKSLPILHVVWKPH